MQKRKSTNISAVETAIAKSVDIDTDQTDTPRSSELEDLNATGQSDDEKAEPRSAAPPIVPDGEPAIAIAKPTAFTLDKFKSKRAVALAGVETLQTALPHHSISQAKDFVRLHEDESKYWSSELCFVSVPIKGQTRDTLHLIDEDIAMRYLPSAKVLRFRLALASKPFDNFFLCHVPSRNTDNSWNESNQQACEQAKSRWVQASSRREEGVDAYKIDAARDPDAFPEPNWPKQSLDDLILATFGNRMIASEDHPGLLRLIGAKQSTS
jgi:hypothetical protein